ncbi:helix-turn-helix transcriptional regulator [Glutamicibacter halophytocola]|uniref:Transcriptional regulator n=1 Tax=Glutamicibacter halophytocola TaxID=1933880 RepID=A0AA95BRH6_9MICC|nr:metalloregulator ArsR/SmtB family transcription factor [Glutamicibacter halophytocola]UUX57598.1 transcriptional regulator [Glutamicibacter halophytocola]
MYSSNLDSPSGSPADTVGAVGDTEERTRDRVLYAVLEDGPVSAAELGNKLGFTPAAVRRHLDALSKSGLVEVKLVANQKSGAGRPSRRYVLSHRGQTKLGNDYLEIATDALKMLGDAAGDDAIRKFARNRFAEMETRYAKALAGVEGLEARAEVLSNLLSSDGFVGYTRKVDTKVATALMHSVQLCQGHCPIQDLAREFPVFCDTETEMFARLLGVDVRRLSTLAGGGHVCTTHIPVGRGKAPMRAEKRTRIQFTKQERPR